MQRAFILGTDGAIGSVLWHFLSDQGARVIGTTRRRESVTENIVPFDLSRDSVQSLSPKADVAYLCAAITSIAQCQADPIGTREINVRRIVEIARKLRAEGTFVVFLSSNSVFDGTAPFVHEGEGPAPVTEYGKQKAEAELQVLALGGTSVVRLTKVLDSGTPLLADWRREVLRNRAIHPFEDLLMSPVSMRFAVDLLARVGTGRVAGVFHGSGLKDISYAEFAGCFVRSLGLDDKFVVPTSSGGAGVVLAHRPDFTSLGMQRTRMHFGIGPQPLADVVADVTGGH